MANRPKILFLLAVVLFSAACIVNIVSWPIDPDLDHALITGGLVALSAGFVL